MKYKITIIKYDKNENYESEMAKYKEESNRYGSRNYDPIREMPSPETATRSLEVFLTDEEYKKVKAEVVKVFE